MKLTRLPIFLAMTVTSLFAADTIRSSPTAATYTQYFSGAEQDALDRRLTPITNAYRAECPAPHLGCCHRMVAQ